MKRWITTDDFRETFYKGLQRGIGFIFSKFSMSSSDRTKSAFSDSAMSSSNWWIVPEIRERWNEKITGSKTLAYEGYLSGKYFSNGTNSKMLSLGCGVCSHEIKFAKSGLFESIDCVDIADNLLRKAEFTASDEGIKNMFFHTCDINEFDFKIEEYDAVLFHSSLHHFENVEYLLSTKIKESLKPEGKVIIHEYVGPNRMQMHSHQIKSINSLIKKIPLELRKRFKIPFKKSYYSGPGWLRMKIADPSECVDSESIIPAFDKHYKCLEKTALGGNLLMYSLKDIAHNFVPSTERKQNILNELFAAEDHYLKSNPSDFVFAVYQKSI